MNDESKAPAEAVYLLDGTDYLHLRENSGGIGFALYDKESCECLGTGIIAKEQLLDYGASVLAAARAHIFLEHLAEPPDTVQPVAISTLEPFRESGVRKRQLLDADSLPKDDILFIDSSYNELFRIPNGGVTHVDYPDGRSFTAKCNFIDSYHTEVGGNVYHICEFAERMERGGGKYQPETLTNREEVAWDLGRQGYLALQTCDSGWDYTFYNKDFSQRDGGQLDAPELLAEEAREEILSAFDLGRTTRHEVAYDELLEKADERANQTNILDELAALKAAQPERKAAPSKHKEAERWAS